MAGAAALLVASTARADDVRRVVTGLDTTTTRSFCSTATCP
jgi:hypothetical protein